MAFNCVVKLIWLKGSNATIAYKPSVIMQNETTSEVYCHYVREQVRPAGDSPIPGVTMNLVDRSLGPANSSSPNQNPDLWLCTFINFKASFQLGSSTRLDHLEGEYCAVQRRTSMYRKSRHPLMVTIPLAVKQKSCQRPRYRLQWICMFLPFPKSPFLRGKFKEVKEGR
ncbi:unnamed protein product [Prunus armeniaca]|uniref:Uncharacterized protein n=1 Tax=Prunus armeniaca TaxID=36596 RepID=A0A6J5WIW7_PRUAR|nr:unnamed protein product [Prunus armeniaca]